MPAAAMFPARLSRFSRAMAVVTTAGIVIVIVLMLAALAIPDWTRNLLLARLGQAGQTLPLTLEGRFAAAAIIAVPLCVLLYGLWQVRLLFQGFACGQVFTSMAARRLRIFAATVLAQAVLGPLTSTALIIALSLGNPPGSRMIGIAFSINDYVALIVGGLLLAIAWVMGEAARLAEENASFV